MPPKSVVSWSSGKDAAFALIEARRLGLADVVGVLTTVDETDGHVPIHGVDRSSLARQVAALGLDSTLVRLPRASPNRVYEARLTAAYARLREAGIAHVVFGDLFLEEIRAYRDRLLAACGMTGIYPLWDRDTSEVARAIVASGIVARIVAVDPARVDACLVGRLFDEALIESLPAGVDPCGENGEFHTFVEGGPMMKERVAVVIRSTDSPRVTDNTGNVVVT